MRRVFIVLLLGLLGSPSFAAESPSPVVSPIRLNNEAIAGLDLVTIPWPAKDRIARVKPLFGSDELSVTVFESTPADASNPKPTMTRIRQPYPYDQFVLVLSGKAVLTDTAGRAQTFVAGDSFIVPKDFRGTWEDHGVYREIMVVWGTAAKTRKLVVE